MQNATNQGGNSRRMTCVEIVDAETRPTKVEIVGCLFWFKHMIDGVLLLSLSRDIAVTRNAIVVLKDEEETKAKICKSSTTKCLG